MNVDDLLNNNSESSELELLFVRMCKLLEFDLDGWQREVEFDGFRRWRLDFAHTGLRIAIELDGGTQRMGKSRHTSPQGYQNDCTKLNKAAATGWLVLRFTSRDLHRRPAYCIRMIRETIKTRTRCDWRPTW